MAPSNTTPHIEDLLKHADWVRGLARRLVNDDAQAEDLVQDTWLTAIERPPAHAGNIRAWLGRVVTNLAASRGRSNRRRNFREEQAARPEAEEFGADLAREAGLTAELVEQVLQLPEPYRAVLLLRYFRGRKPTQIARELDRSLSTVKTQLQRGIERLRASFDERYGDREKWCSALAPLLRWGAPATGALGSLLPLAAVLTILAGIVASQWWMPAVQHSALLVDESSESQHEAALPGIELEDVQAVDADDERIAAEANQTQTAESKSQDVVEPVSTLELFKLHGRLLTVEGKPVAGARLEWIDPSNLRWSDDRQQRIVGEDIWMPIAAELRETLREDAEQRSQFAVRNFRRHDLAVALLADEALPTYQSTTSFDGRFVLAVPGHGKYLRLLDESMGIIGRSSTLDEHTNEAEETWFVAKHVKLAGVVIDEEGDGVADAKIEATVSYPSALTSQLEMGRGFSSQSISVTTDAEGKFEFAAVPNAEGFWVTISKEGHREEGTRVLLQPDVRAKDDLVFGLPTLESTVVTTLSGYVLLADGSPAPRAHLRLGRLHTESTSDGSYELAIYDLASLAGEDLYAARAGSGIALAYGIGDSLLSNPAEVRGPDLYLSAESLVLRGQVIDDMGQPIEGASVSLLDDHRSGIETLSLEDIAAGRTLGWIETDKEGRFALHGLMVQEYRILVRHRNREVRSAAARAGSEEIRIEW